MKLTARETTVQTAKVVLDHYNGQLTTELILKININF